MTDLKETTALSGVDSLLGQINDCDSHEMIPAALWGEFFGDVGTMFSGLLELLADNAEEQLVDLKADITRDEVPITPESVWKREGWGRISPKAPGAIDMNRRLEVLDLMGVKRQFLFSTYGLMGLVLSSCSISLLEGFFGGLPPDIGEEQVRMFGKMISRSWNDWVIQGQKIDPDRLRIVAVAPSADLDELMEETTRLLASGVRNLQLPVSTPPGGKSPADRAMEPFWAMCEEADATVLLHLAFEDFMRTSVWGDIPEFKKDAIHSAEFIVDPWSMATSHLPLENFLTTIILGGVFERHPRLRLGVIECGAYWAGPLAENMDRWAGLFKQRMSKILSMPPSHYLNQNIRITPFWFEPVARYVERYGFEDVWIYGSDYPHVEGGVDQIETFAKSTAPAGASFQEKFFVTNSEWLMPTSS